MQTNTSRTVHLDDWHMQSSKWTSLPLQLSATSSNNHVNNVYSGKKPWCCSEKNKNDIHTYNKNNNIPINVNSTNEDLKVLIKTCNNNYCHSNNSNNQSKYNGNGDCNNKHSYHPSTCNRRRAFSQSETRKSSLLASSSTTTTTRTSLSSTRATLSHKTITIPSTHSTQNLQLPHRICIRQGSPTNDIIINNENDYNYEEIYYYKNLIQPTTWRQSRLEMFCDNCIDDIHYNEKKSSRRRLLGLEGEHNSGGIGISGGGGCGGLSSNHDNRNHSTGNTSSMSLSPSTTNQGTITTATNNTNNNHIHTTTNISSSTKNAIVKKISYYYYHYYSKKKYTFTFLLCMVLIVSTSVSVNSNSISAARSILPLQNQKQYVDETEVRQLEKSLSSSLSNNNPHHHHHGNIVVPNIVQPRRISTTQHNQKEKPKKKHFPKLTQPNTLLTQQFHSSLQNKNQPQPIIIQQVDKNDIQIMDSNYSLFRNNYDGLRKRRRNETQTKNDHHNYQIMYNGVMFCLVISIIGVVLHLGGIRRNIRQSSRRRLHFSGMMDL